MEFQQNLVNLPFVIIIFSVPIDTVKEIRCGKNTDVFREMDRDDFQEDCAFSIIYSDSYETLNLVAYSPDEANIWVTGLRCLLDSDKGKKWDITWVHIVVLVKNFGFNCDKINFWSSEGECVNVYM